MYDRATVTDSSFYGAEPIWLTVEKSGLKSASYFWVGSEAIGKSPSIYKNYDSSVSFISRVDSVMTWFSMPEPERPELVLLYFSEPDHHGHMFGPDSFEVEDMIVQSDQLLGYILEKIEQDSFSINDDGAINQQFSHLDEDIKIIMNKYREKCSIDSWSSLSASNLDSLNTITNDMRLQILKLGSLDQEIEADLISDKNRYDQLVEQTGDLIASEEELQTVIKKLEFSISEKFSETFQMVNEKFNHYFREVFDGGNAELKMISAENKSEQGIEIIVKPPGKRLSNLAALSGGERAMTSVALMFALMSVNPSPICVLDEIDAALDDANVKRFLRILNELSQNSQFIVITHNRITVQDAETVYGISMEQDATSTVLSLKIKDLVN